MKKPAQVIGRVLGWVLVSLGMLLGTAILASLVHSHVIFIEARVVALGIAGAIAVAGLLLVLLCRTKHIELIPRRVSERCRSGGQAAPQER